jgi:hypothetical protein
VRTRNVEKTNELPQKKNDNDMHFFSSENGTPMNFAGPNGDTPRKLLPILDDDEDEDGDETEEEEEDEIQLEK